MKKGFRIMAAALAFTLVFALATPALAVSTWPNAKWNQSTLGVLVTGTKHPARVTLVQWSCYAAQATNSKGKVMGKSEVDGIFGKGTEQYVKSYQLKNGLKADGKVGNGTWASMQKKLVSRAKASNDKVYYNIQDRLSVSKAACHTDKGIWYTFSRSGKTLRVK